MLTLLLSLSLSLYRQTLKTIFFFFVQKLQSGSILIKTRAFVDYRKYIKNKKRG